MSAAAALDSEEQQLHLQAAWRQVLLMGIRTQQLLNRAGHQTSSMAFTRSNSMQPWEAAAAALQPVPVQSVLFTQTSATNIWGNMAQAGLAYPTYLTGDLTLAEEAPPQATHKQGKWKAPAPAPPSPQSVEVPKERLDLEARTLQQQLGKAP
jgi:hypothetical protein